jgi:hypothetical protein
MTAITILAETTMTAAAEIIAKKGIDRNALDYEQLTATMRRKIKDALPDLFAEWKKAIDANLSDGWLKQMIVAQATQIAYQALQEENLI